MLLATHDADYNKKEKIILLGCGGHAKSVVDAIESDGKYTIVGFVDKESNNFSYRGYSVIGQDDDLEDFFKQGITRVFVCVGYMGKGKTREELFAKLRHIGYEFPVIIDPTATLAADAVVGEGSFIGKNVVINANAEIGSMCIINTAAVVEHDCLIGDFTHIAVGSVLCGGVTVGQSCLIGANATVIQGREIGDNCIIGAGVVVRKNVECGAMVR